MIGLPPSRLLLPARRFGAAWRGRKWLGVASCCLGAAGLRLALYWWLARPFGGLSAASCHFDCDFYLRIATGGYGADAEFHDRGSYPNWAYFPLLPLLIRGGVAETGWPPAVVGLLVSNVALAALAMLGTAYLLHSRPRAEPGLWQLVLWTAPFGFFFSVPYTESLFAALTVGVLLMRAQGRLLAAAACAALASAARPTGVLISVLAAADGLRTLLAPGSPDGAPDPARDRALLAVALAPLGLLLFVLWQYLQVGDGLAFSHVQVAWDRRFLGPVTWILLGLRVDDWRLAAALFPEQSYSFNAACVLLGLALSGWLAWRRSWAEAWVAGACIALPLSTGLHSMGRFVGTNPAILFAVYDAMVLLPRRGLGRTAVLVTMVSVQACLLTAWYGKSGGLF